MDTIKSGINLESDFQAHPIAQTSPNSQLLSADSPHSQHIQIQASNQIPEEEKKESIINPEPQESQKHLEEHPLIALETKERLGFDKFEGKEVTYQEISPLQQKKDLPFNVASEGIDRIDLDIVPKYNFSHDFSGQYFHSYENMGQPLCITVLPGRYVAMGTSNGLILVYDYELKPYSTFGKIKKKEYGAITAIDISPSEEFVVCGYSSGNVILWSLSNAEFIKSAKITKKKEPILNIKFLMSSDTFITSIPDGSVYICKIQSGLFLWSIEQTELDLKSSQQKGPSDSEQEYRQAPKTSAIFPDGFFAVCPMPKESTEDYEDDPEIVALACMSEVVVVSLESFSHFVYRYKRPPGISDSTVPCISWGRGIAPGEGNPIETLLALSWGKDLFLLKIENREGFETYAENGEKLERMNTVGYYHSQDIIHALEWVSVSKLVTYSTTGKYKILHTENFRRWHDGREDFDYSNANITSIALKADETQFQICIDKEKESRHQKSVLYFTQTIRGLNGRDQVIAIGKTNIFALKHLDWQDTLTKLFEKADWLSALSLCAAIYNDPAAVFAGLPPDPIKRREVVGNYAIDLANRYVKAIHRLGHFAPTNVKQDEVWQPVLLTVIDFMLSTGNIECLFSEMKSILQAIGLYNMFFQSLKPFIQARILQAAPIDALKEIVKFYLKEGRADIARYLIINVSSANIDFAITLCLQNNLLTPLLYICSHRKSPGGPDFLTPLGRALGMYKKSVEEKAPNMEYGMKFLWFLHMILNGRMFPGGVLSDEVWEAKVKDILILIFEEANVDLLLSIQPYVTFEILEVLFKPTLTYLIKSWDDDMIQFMDVTNLHVMSSSGNNRKFQRLSQQFHSHFECSTSSMIQDRMLGLIYYCSRKDSKYDNHLFYFLASLYVNYNCKLPLDVVEESFLYIIKSPYVLPKWRILAQNDNQSLEDSLKEERGLYLLELFKRLESTLDDKFLEEVSLLVEQTDFLEIRSYIYNIKKDYNKTFKMFLSQKTKSRQMKIFEWLRGLIFKMKDESPEELDALKELIISKLESLIPVDSQETRQLISILGPKSANLDTEVLKHLESSPSLQLDYLKDTIIRGESGSATDETKGLYMKLLCQKSPSSVLEELKARDYPLDKCIKLCKEYHIKDALAFLLEKVGYYKGALEVRLEIFEGDLQKEDSIEDELNQKFKDVLNTCVFCDHTESSNLQELWFFGFDKLIDLYKKYIVPRQELNKVYVGYLSELIEGMSKVIPVEAVIGKIESYTEPQLEDLKNSLLEVCESQKSDKQGNL